MTEDEMAGWLHQLGGHEFEQAPGVGDGQGGLACCRLWGRRELGTPERRNNKIGHGGSVSFFLLIFTLF